MPILREGRSDSDFSYIFVPRYCYFLYFPLPFFSLWLAHVCIVQRQDVALGRMIDIDALGVRVASSFHQDGSEANIASRFKAADGDKWSIKEPTAWRIIRSATQARIACGGLGRSVPERSMVGWFYCPRLPDLGASLALIESM